MKMTKTKDIPNLIVFSETLQALAENDRDILVLTSDSRGSGKLVPFGEKFPDQIVEVGIAEQNLVGMAAGLASMGKKAFAVSPACFMTARSLEQIKNDVAYSDNPVKLIGISAGVSYGALGTTHHSLHDFAVLRAIHNMTIVAPCDNFETTEAVKQAAEMTSPVYVRFGKKGMPTLNRNIDPDFKIGRGRTIREGEDLTFIGTGEAVLPCEEAAALLEKKYGIHCRVISLHTIKPLDKKLILQAAANRRPVITSEEHSVHGGLGEAVASLLFQKGCRNPFRIVGLPDEHTITGSQVEIFDHYGISGEGLMQTALQLLKQNE
jgi:transketolase